MSVEVVPEWSSVLVMWSCDVYGSLTRLFESGWAADFDVDYEVSVCVRSCYRDVVVKVYAEVI